MKYLLVPLALALAAPAAHAVTLNPRGTGQALIYPYFTVNKQQQTVLSVVNTTGHGKALRVNFRETYNGRRVISFNVYIAPYDVWTTTVFALTDASLEGDAAAFTTADRSCVVPDPSVWTGTLPNHQPYQSFLEYDYTGVNADGAPTSLTRTREGYAEIIEMAEVTGATLFGIEPVNGIPVNCAVVNSPAVPAGDLAAPGGGLYGSAAVINVAQGTMYAFAAEALDGFSNKVNFVARASDADLGLDGAAGPNGVVSAYVPTSAGVVRADYPTTGAAPSQAIDAVSAVLAADQLYAEYDLTAAAGVQSEWLLTFPTKRYYTDRRLVGSNAAVAPFAEVFTGGKSCVAYTVADYDREGQSNGVEFSAAPPPNPLCAATQVLLPRAPGQGTAGPFSGNSPVLGSTLIVPVGVDAPSGSVAIGLNPSYQPHWLRPAADGKRIGGLPAIGFMAQNSINATVTPGVLANYSAAYPLRASVTCKKSDNTACP